MITNCSVSYIKASGWFVVSILCGFLNDYLIKYIAVSDFVEISTIQTIFLRFFFGALILLPTFIANRIRNNSRSEHIRHDTKCSKCSLLRCVLSKRVLQHSIRSVLFFVPMVLWVYGIEKGSLIFATFMEFAIPLFVILIARVLLGESLKGRLSSTIIGIIGIFVVAQKYVALVSLSIVVCMTLAAFLFALSDIVNKYLLNEEEQIIDMLFFTSLGVSIVSAPFLFKLWSNVSFCQLVFYFLQGLSGNLSFFFILKAYKLSTLSSLQPLRFFALPLSMFFSLKLGDALCIQSICIGMLLLIASLIYSMFYEICVSKDNI